MCIKGKRILKKYIGERFWEERNKNKKKKKSNSKKVEKVIPVSAGEEIKRPLGLRKKQMETNEDKVDKRMKKKINVIRNKKNQQETID